jgi:hypothetical protein
MAKDAYWFSHDSNARHDPKMVRLRMKHGLVGIGFYWCCIEFLREQDQYMATREEFEALEFEVGETTGVLNTMIQLGLIESNCDNYYSQSLKNRMFEWDERKRKLSEAGKRGGRPLKAMKKGGFKQDKARPKPAESYNIIGHNRREEKKNYSDDAMRVAEYLLAQIKTHKPDIKSPNLDRWAVDIDKAIRIDRRDPRRLCEVAKWAHSIDPEEFWKANLLSGNKLRKQFDQIEIKMNRQNNAKAPMTAAQAQQERNKKLLEDFENELETSDYKNNEIDELGISGKIRIVGRANSDMDPDAV